MTPLDDDFVLPLVFARTLALAAGTGLVLAALSRVLVHGFFFNP